jgi:hypothetical protein
MPRNGARHCLAEREKMTKLHFSSRNLPRENGGATYAIWKDSPDGFCIAGYISKTLRKTWQVDLIKTRHASPYIKETPRFADAKRMAREALA